MLPLQPTPGLDQPMGTGSMIRLAGPESRPGERLSLPGCALVGMIDKLF